MDNKVNNKLTPSLLGGGQNNTTVCLKNNNNYGKESLSNQTLFIVVFYL